MDTGEEGTLDLITTGIGRTSLTFSIDVELLKNTISSKKVTLVATKNRHNSGLYH